MKKIIDFIVRNKMLIGGCLLVIMLLVVMLVASINYKFSAGVDIVVVPTDAKILIGGTEYKNGIHQGLLVGSANVEITREGYEPKSFDIELKQGEVTKIYVALEGGNDWSEDEMDENTKRLLEIINEYNGELETKELIKKYPVMKDLPIVVESYQNNYSDYVSYRVDGGKYDECEREFCLKITDISGGNYERAVEALRNKGHEADDYEVIYVDASRKGHAG